MNFHHVFSTVTMDDPAVFTDVVNYTLSVTTQRTIYIMTNLVESFGYLLTMNDEYIDTFSKIPIMQIMPERICKES